MVHASEFDSIKNTNYIVKKSFWRMLPPMIFSNVALNTASITDLALSSIFCGEEGLAVITLFFPLFYIWDCLTFFFSNGSTTLFSIAKGEKDHHKAQNIFASSLTAMVLTALLVCICSTAANPIIVNILGFEGKLLPAGLEYGKWFGAAMAMGVVSETLVGFMNATSSPRLASLCTFVQISMNLILDIVFMGWLKTGVVGTNYAFLISSTTATLIGLWYLIWKQNYIKISFKIMNPQIFYSTLKFSYHSIIQGMGIGFVMMLINKMLMTRFGIPAIVVLSVINATNTICMIFAESLEHCAALIVGSFWGEHDIEATMVSAKKGYRITLYCGLGVLAILLIYPQLFIYIFGLENRAHFNAAVTATRIFSLSILFFMLNSYSITLLQTLGKSFTALFISVFHSIILPLCTALIMINSVELEHFWFYFLIYELVSSCFILPLTLWILKHIKEKFKPDNNEDRYAFLISNELPDIIKRRDQMENFLKAHNIHPKKVLGAVLAFEEMATYAISNTGKTAGTFMDMRISVKNNELKISIRYDGKMDNINAILEDSSGNYSQKTVGLKLLCGVSDSYYYDELCCLNHIIVKISLI